MKIVVNTRSLIQNKLDGIGWFTYQTLKRITKNHPEHEFIFLFDRKYSNEFLFEKNVTPIILFPPARHPFLYIIFYQWSVRRVLRKLKPDLFLAPDGLLALGSACKQLAVIHDINFFHYPKDLAFWYSKYYSFFIPKFIKEANRIVSVSEFSKQDIIKNYGTKPEKIDVVYNGIHEGYKPIEPIIKQEISKKYSNGNPYFLFVGSLSPRKNLIRLVDAFSLFMETAENDFQLLLVGSIFWGEKDLDQAIQGSKYSKNIRIVGRVNQEELEKIMGAAFALTFVSYFEGFGIPLVEAMQSEVPIICSNTSCMPEIAGEVAIYVDPFNVESIAEGMHKLANSESLRKALIEKGKQQKLKFSWDQSATLLWKSMLQAIAYKTT